MGEVFTTLVIASFYTVGFLTVFGIVEVGAIMLTAWSERRRKP